LLQLSFFFFIQTSKHKAAPCQQKKGKGKNDSSDSCGFSGKSIERGHGTKIFVEKQTPFSVNKSLMTLRTKLFSVKYV